YGVRMRTPRLTERSQVTVPSVKLRGQHPIIPSSHLLADGWYVPAARGHVQGAIKGWASSPRGHPRSSRRAQSSTTSSGEVPATARVDPRRVGSGMALPAPRSVGCGGSGLIVGYVPWR